MCWLIRVVVGAYVGVCVWGTVGVETAEGVGALCVRERVAVGGRDRVCDLEGVD